MPTSAQASLHPLQYKGLAQLNAGGYEPPDTSAVTTGGTTNGLPLANTGWAPITMMGDTIKAKITNIMHIPFPVSKNAVRSFRGELEDNIEFITRPDGPKRLRDLLIPGTSKFNPSGPFSTPRGYEEPLMIRNGKPVARGALHMDDLMSSPINSEASPPPSPMPIYETPTYRRDGKEFNVEDNMSNYGMSKEPGVYMHTAATTKGAKTNPSSADRVPNSPGLVSGAYGINVHKYGTISLPSDVKAMKIDMPKELQFREDVNNDLKDKEITHQFRQKNKKVHKNKNKKHSHMGKKKSN